MGNALVGASASGSSGTEAEKLIAHLNRIACSKIMKSSDADLEKMDSPEYCQSIVLVSEMALLKYMKTQSMTGQNGQKLVYILEGQQSSRKDEDQARKSICAGLAYDYVLVYKIYQLIRSVVGHQGEVQELCKEITPDAKSFGAGYCQERLDAIALDADKAVSDSQVATISSKVCRLPSMDLKGAPEWATRLDGLFEKMKKGSNDTKAHQSQISRLDVRIGKQDATSTLGRRAPTKFADIKPLDRGSSDAAKAACMEAENRDLPNAYYEFQINSPSLLSEHKSIESKMRAAMGSSAAKLSAILRKIFVGFNSPGAELTLAAGLNSNKLQAIATETAMKS